MFEEIPSIRWGGRVGRYQESRRGVVRCVDPLSGKSLSFVSDWALENYLLSRFDPTVDTVRRALVVTAAGRQPVSAIADLLIERVNGRLEIQLICLREPPPAKFRVLKRQAEDQGARLVIRRRADIRANPILLRNLRHLRQVMTQHYGMGRHLDSMLSEALGVGAMSRADMARVVTGEDPQLIDARLGHLHCNGTIEIDLHRRAYGRQTIIRRA